MSQTPKTIVFAIFDATDLKGVQDWFGKHQTEYHLDKPALLPSPSGDRVWCYGTSADFIVEQENVIQKVKRNLGGGLLGAAPALNGMPQISRPR